MKIRPHHILCTRAFRGNGYSDSFVINTYKVIKKMKKRNKITLTDKADCICSHCPKRSNGKCGFNTIVNIDSNTRMILRLEKDTYSYEEIETKIEEFLTEELFNKICETCEWKQKSICNYEKIRERFC